MSDELFSNINKAKDNTNLTDLEKKHMPVIDAPDKVKAGEPFDVSVEVGKLLKHPNEPEHHIQWIVLLSGSLTLAITQLTPKTTNPKVSISVTLTENAALRALERCNIHGEWEYTKEIEVVQ